METTHDKIKKINISSEMKNSFLNYAMSVIVARALPDVRDGLKPVQRRILYAMSELNMGANQPYKKSARIVGEVMGKYHPHGDSSIYDAMVRMAQPFSYRNMLIDGHGNFGSVDGDAPAAMRYTEARMSKIASEMVKDIDKNTVNFIDNYDSSEQEPNVLPSRYPNLLVNGSTGIAVGMATNMAPHNLAEVIDGLLAYIDNNDITVYELMAIIKGPDFPTGGQVLGISGLRSAYETGRGSVVIRAKHHINRLKNEKTELVITEIPYQVNKTSLIEKIAEVVKEKILEGITGLRDESSRKGMKIVIELRKDINPEVMMNNLYKHTQLQTSFGFNMIALVDGKPEMLTLKTALSYYLKHQVEVIQRRTQFDLEKAQARLHILEGLVKALSNIDQSIEIIKSSQTPEIARNKLIEVFELSEIQARNILSSQLSRLTGLEIEKIQEEAKELVVKVADYQKILGSYEVKLDIIKTELIEIKDKYGDERRSEINLYEDIEIDNEDLIPVENIMVTVTNNGYIKRMSVDEYKVQNRGGVGLAGIKTHEDDHVEHIQSSSTHDFHLFFTNKGRVFKLKGYRLPAGSRISKGLPIVNFLNFLDGEKLASFTSVKNFDDKDAHLLFVTKAGIIKKTHISAYQNIRTNGIIAITLKESDELLSVLPTSDHGDVILGASNGKAIRFNHYGVRPIGRTASGVRGMRLDEGDEIVGATIAKGENQEILVITENGFGKKTSVDEYRLQQRGGKGVKTLNITERKGNLATLTSVNEDQDLIVVTNKGITIRIHIKNITTSGRATQGSRIINLRADQKVSTVAIVDYQEVEEDVVVEALEVVQETIEIKEDKKIIKVASLAVEETEKSEEIVITQEKLI